MNWFRLIMSWLGNHRPALTVPVANPNAHPRFNYNGIPGQITKNFNIDELKTRDNTPVPEKFWDNAEKVTKDAQVIRDYFGKSARVISGYRHPAYNRKVGGAKKSQHLTASALDIVISGVSARKVANAVVKLKTEGKIGKGGLGRYPNFTHIDIRPKNVSWGSNTRKKK